MKNIDPQQLRMGSDSEKDFFFNKKISFGKTSYSISFSTHIIDSNTRKYVLMMGKHHKKKTGTNSLHQISTRSWFFLKHFNRIRLGQAKRSQIIEETSS